ncbi:MAG: P-loop NTPase, partial [Candidatus Nanopelagicaceae bacterium]
AYLPEGSQTTVALFGEGGGEETAKRLSNLVGAEVPLLGKIPFDIALREGGDVGHPVVIARPDSPAASEFEDVIDKLTLRKKSLLGVRLGLST